MPEEIEFVYTPDETAGTFTILVAKEMVPTVDGRMFSAGSISYRELPIPLTLNRVNTAEGQHKEAIGIGTITEMWMDDGSLYGKGFFSSDEEGQNARQLIKEGIISSVSADVGGVTEELEIGDEYPEGVRKVITKGTVIGVTALLHGSFNETKIAVDAAPLTAAGGVAWEPPADAFVNPKLTEPTALTVTADGRVFGHAALWGTCHVGYKDRCVTPPRSASNYSFFSVGTVLASGGKTLPVGRITANTGHASMELGAQPAKEHYDHTGFAAAFVAAGEDEFGIWYSGVLAPDATEAQVANLRSAGVSGDWRSIAGSLEMVGLLAVNTPGFPVPRTKAGLVAGAQVSLVAAGMVMSGKKCKGCADGHGCAGCADAKDVTGLEAEADCGCDEAEETFEHDSIEWITDLDQTFLAQLAEHYGEILELTRQANDYGTPLSAPVQGYANEMQLYFTDQKRYVDGSIGRYVVPPAEAPDPVEAAYAASEENYRILERERLGAELALADADILITSLSPEIRNKFPRA